MWKPKVLTIRNVYTRICELNSQLTSYPNQTGLLPEDEMKSAFINLCLPDWQQEFLKTGINQQDSAVGNAKKNWNENKKRSPTSYSMEQLKGVVRMTRKKALEDAKAHFDLQVQEEMHVLELKKGCSTRVRKNASNGTLYQQSD